jgi:hypothetical protein
MRFPFVRQPPSKSVAQPPRIRLSERLFRILPLALALGQAARLPAKTIPMIPQYGLFELSLKTEPTQGNPFDPSENEIHAILAEPSGPTLSLPAFYDGDDLWRMRFTPSRPGVYRYRIVASGKTRLKGDEETSGEFRVAPSKASGFVRISKKSPRRFAFDSGAPYYPAGHDVAWTSPWEPNHVEYDQYFRAMHQAGENWARVWMCAWGGLNLEWTPGQLGRYDLKAARYLDRVISWAEKNGIYVQLTLQHHGQFSTRVNPNWNENPYSKANGGFLDNPGEFFTSERAKELTRRKFRYILTRWGYSPHVMAWELFNEVQFTDMRNWDDVARWHGEMADFIRRNDPYRHLVTTSSPAFDSPVWNSMDYLQAHNYNDDPGVSGVSPVPPSSVRKPYFVGEWGASNGAGPDSGGDAFLRQGLWAGMMAGPSAMPMFWAWDYVHRHDLYPVFGAAARFASVSGLAEWPDLKPAPVTVESKELGPMTVAPGLGWEPSKESEFPISPNMGRKISGMASYIQGRAHPDMMPKAPTLLLDAPAETEVSLEVSEVSDSGGTLSLALDGKEILRRDFPPKSIERGRPVVAKAEIPAGRHRLTLSNPGADWFRLSGIVFSRYAPRLKAQVLAGSDHAIVWLSQESPDGGASGKVSFEGLKTGAYRVTRYDPATMKIAGESEASAKEGKANLSVASLTSDRVYVFKKISGK